MTEWCDPYVGGFTMGLLGEPPLAPPTREMKDSWFGGLKETKSSIERTAYWHEWTRGWKDGIDSRIKSAA